MLRQFLMLIVIAADVDKFERHSVLDVVQQELLLSAEINVVRCTTYFCKRWKHPSGDLLAVADCYLARITDTEQCESGHALFTVLGVLIWSYRLWYDRPDGAFELICRAMLRWINANNFAVFFNAFACEAQPGHEQVNFLDLMTGGQFTHEMILFVRDFVRSTSLCRNICRWPCAKSSPKPLSLVQVHFQFVSGSTVSGFGAPYDIPHNLRDLCPITAQKSVTDDRTAPDLALHSWRRKLTLPQDACRKRKLCTAPSPSERAVKTVHVQMSERSSEAL